MKHSPNMLLVGQELGSTSDTMMHLKVVNGEEMMTHLGAVSLIEPGDAIATIAVGKKRVLMAQEAGAHITP